MYALSIVILFHIVLFMSGQAYASLDKSWQTFCAIVMKGEARLTGREEDALLVCS